MDWCYSWEEELQGSEAELGKCSVDRWEAEPGRGWADLVGALGR